MSDQEKYVCGSGCERLRVAAVALRIGTAGAASIFGIPSSWASPAYERGQVTVTIVDSAALKGGTARDSTGQLLHSAATKTQKPPHVKVRQSAQFKTERSEMLIIIDLP